MESISKVFGEVLFELRTQKKMTQEKLAELSDVDRKYIYMLEKGKRQPSLTTVFAIAAALGMKPEELVRRVGEEYNKK